MWLCWHFSEQLFSKICFKVLFLLGILHLSLGGGWGGGRGTSLKNMVMSIFGIYGRNTKMLSRSGERQEKYLKWPKPRNSHDKLCTSSRWNKKYKVSIWLMCYQSWLIDFRQFHPWWPMILYLTNQQNINIKDGGNLVQVLLSLWFLEKIIVIIIFLKHSWQLTMYMEISEHIFVVRKQAE